MGVGWGLVFWHASAVPSSIGGWDMRNWIASLVGMIGATGAYAVIFFGFAGWAYWMWMAIQLGSFWMFLFGLLGPLGLIAALLGMWSLIFGAPAWLIHLVS
jgi:hypothetical protein